MENIGKQHMENMQATKNYDLFKKICGNRRIIETHVKELMDSIQKNNLLSARPILVNQDMEIIDGQHRYEAAKRLGLEIFYVKADKLSIQEVAVINTNQRNWRMEDFLSVYSKHLKNPDYIKLNEWLEFHGFTLAQGISFFMDESSILEFRNQFKNGEFKFNDKISSFADAYKALIKKIESFGRGSLRPWAQQGFVRAFLMFYGNPEIDQKRFWDQIDKYNFLISAKRTKQEYLDMLYEVYNYRRHLKVEG